MGRPKGSKNKKAFSETAIGDIAPVVPRYELRPVTSAAVFPRYERPKTYMEFVLNRIAFTNSTNPDTLDIIVKHISSIRPKDRLVIHSDVYSSALSNPNTRLDTLITAKSKEEGYPLDERDPIIMGIINVGIASMLRDEANNTSRSHT
jgi:hypothetical protein